MVEKPLCADPCVNTKFLRQISELAANLNRLRQDINAVQMDTAAVRDLQGRKHAHQCGLASPIWSQQSKQTWRDIEADVVKGTCAVRERVRKVAQ